VLLALNAEYVSVNGLIAINSCTVGYSEAEGLRAEIAARRASEHPQTHKVCERVMVRMAVR